MQNGPETGTHKKFTPAQQRSVDDILRKIFSETIGVYPGSREDKMWHIEQVLGHRKDSPALRRKLEKAGMTFTG